MCNSYSGIKGVAAANQDAAFRSLLHEIDLDDKADAATESLSGGQKRKLSVGIALIGACVLTRPGAHTVEAGRSPFVLLHFASIPPPSSLL